MSMERQASADETETRDRLLLLVGLWWNVFFFFEEMWSRRQDFGPI